MSLLLKQSTAVTILLGPFVDDSDGKTAETGLTIAYTAVYLSKNGGSPASKSETSSAAHTSNGYYTVALNATDTGTLGIMRVFAVGTGAMPVWMDFMVVPAMVYDSLVSGSDYLETDVTQWKGATAPAMTGDAFARIGVNGAGLTAISGSGDPWDDSVHPVRTLTMPAAAVATMLDGTEITLVKGASNVVTLTGLASTSAYTSLYFTVKATEVYPDADATLQIRRVLSPSSNVILRIGRSAPLAGTDGDGTLAPSGTTVVVTLAARSSALLPISTGVWDLKMISPAGVAVLASGKCNIVATATAAVA